MSKYQVSKTQSLENFQDLLKGKSFDELCQLRLDHRTVLWDTTRRLMSETQRIRQAKVLRIPVSVYRILSETPDSIWDSILDSVRYYDWFERRYLADPKNVRDLKKCQNSLLGRKELQG